MPEINIQQRSQQWLDLRKGKITASIVAAICGVCPFKTRLDAYNEIMGISTPFVSKAMKEGTNKEEEAVSFFGKKLGTIFRPAVFIGEYDWAMASLDGINLDEDLILEVKCPQSSSFQKMKECTPLHYRYQMQWQFYCSGISKGFFASKKKKKNWVMHHEIEDYKLIFKILQEVEDFRNNHLIPGIPPEPETKEAVFCDDERFHKCEKDYQDLDLAIKKFTKQRDIFKKIIVENFFDDTAVKGKILLIKQASRKGSLDEAKMIEDGIDLEKYRKTTVLFPMITFLNEEKNDTGF